MSLSKRLSSTQAQLATDSHPKNKSVLGGVSDSGSHDHDDGSPYSKLADEIKAIKANIQRMKAKQ